jgi:hypothetical protein
MEKKPKTIDRVEDLIRELDGGIKDERRIN